MTQVMNARELAGQVHDMIGEAYQRGYRDARDDCSTASELDADAMREGCAQVQADMSDRITALRATPDREAVLEEAAMIVSESDAVRELVEALEFYATPSNWCVYRVSHKPVPHQRFTRITDDRGERARAALTRYRGEG